jgi:NAD(P) transhydrogenase subunit alpha
VTEILLLGVFALATAAGYKVIRNVPPLLHSPLMSGMNALSGITVLGAISATAIGAGTGGAVLGGVAVVLATANVVGGFLVTHRMLRMFRGPGGPEGKS